MKSGHNPNRIEAARKIRDTYADTVRDLCMQGKSAQAISLAIGRSDNFVLRIMSENGIERGTYCPKPPQRVTSHNKQTIAVPTAGYSYASSAVSYISLPPAPWGEFDRDTRHETAPRGRTYMIASPVTRAEQMARELWREAGV